MALRLCSRRIGASVKASSVSTPSHRCYASVAQATAGANLSNQMKDEITKEATLPHADASVDSMTGRLIDTQSPYMVPTYVRPRLIIERGEGCHVWDVENRKFLDFTSGIAVNALGHADPQMSKILYEQSTILVHASNLYYNQWIGRLSEILVEKTRESGAMEGVTQAFVCNSGSEANEAAIKFARKHGRTLDSSGDKHEIVSFHGSFHGRTMGSLSATPNPKYQKPFSPMLPGFRYGTYNDISAIESLVTPTTAGVIVEPIQGEGGVNVATPEFLLALRKRCTDVGALLIFDEIQCGLSRTGTLWGHASASPDGSSIAHPDILTTAKALGNGFPIGATLVTGPVSAAIATGDHGTTFGGNPLGSRLAHHIVTRLSDPTLQAHVRRAEARFRSHFDRLAATFPEVVAETRGRGLILGLQLRADPTPVVTAARERGLLVITCGTNTLRFVPPLVITEEEIDAGMAVLEEAMRVVYRSDESVRPTTGQQEMGSGRAAA